MINILATVERLKASFKCGKVNKKVQDKTENVMQKVGENIWKHIFTMLITCSKK